MHYNVWHDKNLCDLHLTSIIRINKSHAEICRFRVTDFAKLWTLLYCKLPIFLQHQKLTTVLLYEAGQR